MHSCGSILVVDDEALSRLILHDLLSSEGYNVLAADDAFVGLKALRQTRVDLVITDLMMPRMSGMDFLKAVRAQDQDMPVVMITAYPSIDVAVKVMKEGASDFITKPFNCDHVRLVIRRAMEKGMLERQGRALAENEDGGGIIKRINRNLEEKINELSALYAISETLHHPATTAELFEKVVDIASSITEAEKVGLWLLETGGSRIALRAAKGMEGLLEKRFTLAEAGLVGEAISQKRHILSQDYKTCICGGSGTYIKHPFLCAPILIGDRVFAALQLCQKIGGGEFTGDDVSIITSLAQKVSMKMENLALYENLMENLFQSITALVRAIDARDNYTMNHGKRDTLYAVKLAGCLGCPEEVLDAFRFAGPIHDVGKIGVRDGILLKPGFLEPDERDIMKSHTTIGNEIIRPLNLGPLEYAVVRSHHERFDGMGYPDGLKGADIPLVARIFSVIDTYDAMTSNRPYRTARSHEEAIAELMRCRGTQFDGDVVDVFVKHGICKEEVQAA